jgi:hypothetical protein
MAEANWSSHQLRGLQQLVWNVAAVVKCSLKVEDFKIKILANI